MIGRLAYPLRSGFESSPLMGGQGQQEKNREDHDNGCIRLSSPAVASSPSIYPLETNVVFVVERRATIDPTDMGIETAPMECLDAFVVPENHSGRNSNDRDDKGGGEEVAMSPLMREGGTGGRRAGQEKG